jgi:RNA-splicing ligase RtcB
MPNFEFPAGGMDKNPSAEKYVDAVVENSKHLRFQEVAKQKLIDLEAEYNTQLEAINEDEQEALRQSPEKREEIEDYYENLRSTISKAIMADVDVFRQILDESVAKSEPLEEEASVAWKENYGNNLN